MGAHSLSSARFASVIVYWYCVRARRPPTLMSWPACISSDAPPIFASLGRRRPMISSALSLRPSSFGLSAMKKLPVLNCDELPNMPMPLTSGSWRTTSANSTMRRFIDSNDESCDDCALPKMKPVSCCGKKPLGMTMNSATVAASVARNTSSVGNWCFRTKSRPRL